MPDIAIEHVRRLDGRLLLVFRDLLLTENATVTAERLGVSQPAVSHALRRLRQLHGDPLFVRQAHGLRATRRARELAPHVEALVELAGDLYDGGDPFDPASSDRRFRVAAPEFVSARIGAQLLSRWSRAAPGLSLDLRLMPGLDVVDDLISGELDLALGRFPEPTTPTIERESVYSDDYCVVARRDHPSIDDSIDLVTYLTTGHVLATAASEFAPGETVPAELRVVAVVPTWLTALNIVATSDALATCPRRLAEFHAPVLGLQVLAVPGDSPIVEVSVLRRSGDPSPEITWLREELRAVV
jgi:LysR family transcriptional regulator, mexEF-oprN operon transcriptional activator